MSKHDLTIGNHVVYSDNGVVVKGESALCEGIINGDPLHDEETGEVMMVPVFSERSDGREPTTIYVHIANILRSERPV